MLLTKQRFYSLIIEEQIEKKTLIISLKKGSSNLLQNKVNSSIYDE